ncbi:hypothetical protein EAO77_37335 [Streptomyces sp. t39]|nr:hypothetical protein EAO77_37335 [Streptomyces sp. t39]
MFRIGLESSRAHRHFSGGQAGWERGQRDKPFRLWVTCHVDGHKPWHLHADVPQRFGDTPHHAPMQAR